MWGGGMMFPRIVVQEEARRFLDEFGIAYTEYEEGLYVADSIESVCRTAAAAIGAGAKIFNLISVEDVMIREEGHVSGLVINWTSVAAARLHVDPLTIRSKVVIDGTGHDAEVCRIVSRKIPRFSNSQKRYIRGWLSPAWQQMPFPEVTGWVRSLAG
jgi:thiamine thiazole synthase